MVLLNYLKGAEPKVRADMLSAAAKVGNLTRA